MARKIFLLVIGCIIAIIFNPVLLSATDDVALTGLNPDGMVETIPLPEPEPEPEPLPVVTVATTPVVSAPVISNYDVNAYINTPKEFNRIANSLDDGVVYKYRKLVYGHSRSTSLSDLMYKSNNEVITITEGGVATSYRVAFSALYSIAELNVLDSENRSLMENIANGALGHSVALFTCQGDSRRVVFADAI